MTASARASDTKNSAGAADPEIGRSSRPGVARSSMAIEARGLEKHFGSYKAVAGVTFAIPHGQLVAFLGPNGAGKSTTMRMLAGFLTPSAGSASIDGRDVHSDRVNAVRHLGYLPENGPLYPDMTPQGLLAFLGEARGLSASTTRERSAAVVEQCQLGDVLTRPISKLSRGYRQRVGLAAAMLHDPAVLILDEPTAGLDPNQIDHVRAVLAAFAKERTVLLSTHILSEVRALADRVLLVARGRLVHDGPAGSLGKDEREMEEKFRRLTSRSGAE